MIKNTDEQPDEERHKMRCQMVPSTEASGPMELGYVTLLACRCVQEPRSSPKLVFWEMLW